MPTNDKSPKYTHYCNACVFLGTYSHPSYMECDLYYCPDSKDASVASTVIARYDDKEDKYTSGNAFSYMEDRPHHPLVVARHLAENLGITVPRF